jgi:hypothetical protein
VWSVSVSPTEKRKYNFIIPWVSPIRAFARWSQKATKPQSQGDERPGHWLNIRMMETQLKRIRISLRASSSVLARQLLSPGDGITPHLARQPDCSAVAKQLTSSSSASLDPSYQYADRPYHKVFCNTSVKDDDFLFILLCSRLTFVSMVWSVYCWTTNFSSFNHTITNCAPRVDMYHHISPHRLDECSSQSWSTHCRKKKVYVSQ